MVARRAFSGYGPGERGAGILRRNNGVPDRLKIGHYRAAEAFAD
jgi:hypothetical protein